MLGGLRLDKPLELGWRSRSWCGTSCYRSAFVILSHGPRTFHHKTPRPAPQSLTLENLRAATTFTTANPLHFPRIDLHDRIASNSRNGYRFYSSSSTLPTMAEAEVKWTGPLVRKTFLDFFAERGHTIGKGPPPPPHDAMRPCWRALHFLQKNDRQTSPQAGSKCFLRFVSTCTSLTTLPRSAVVVGRPSQ